MTRYQIPREETSINLTNISEQVYVEVMDTMWQLIKKFQLPYIPVNAT